MNGRKLADNVINGLLVVLGIVFLISAQRIEVGTAMGQGGDFMPKVCATAWLIIGALLFIFNIKADIPPRKEPMRVNVFMATLVMLIVYTAALDILGFVLCSVIYLFLQMLLFVPKEKKTKKMIVIFGVISIVAPIAINALFVNVFSLILPTGILG